MAKDDVVVGVAASGVVSDAVIPRGWRNGKGKREI